MTILLHDTTRNAIVPFEPGPHVLIYTCGITPYDATHNDVPEPQRAQAAT